VKSCALAQVTAAVASGAAVPTTASTGAKPSDCVVLPVRNGETRLLLAPLAVDIALGIPAGLSGRDVLSAQSSFSEGTGNAIDLTLTRTGAAKFNALAAAQFGRPSRAPRSPSSLMDSCTRRPRSSRLHSVDTPNSPVTSPPGRPNHSPPGSTRRASVDSRDQEGLGAGVATDPLSTWVD
jgi:hypothetical protein